MVLKFEITMTNKWLYSLMAVGIFLALGVGVLAYNSGGPPSVMGHSSEELEGAIKYLPAPILILDETGAKGGIQTSGSISGYLTINVSTLVPTYANGVVISLSSSFISADDVLGARFWFAWSQLPPITGPGTLLHSPYLVLHNAAGKVYDVGGEADREYAAGSSTFFIPLKDDKTFQIAKRQQNIYSERFFGVSLIGYT